VAVRKDGYGTLKTHGKVIAPWWQWVPFDFFAEFLPLHDHQTLTYTLHPVSAGAVDPHKMLARAEQFGTNLESSEFTHPPSTHPATTRSLRTATTLRAIPTTVTTRPFTSNPTTRPSTPSFP
jgi:hypothetical protein